METVQAVNGSLWDFKGKIDFVDEWYIMRTPLPVFAIWLSYIIFVLKLGPAYMKNRPPFKLRKVLVAYNVVQVIVSCYIFQMGCKLLLRNGLIHQVCLSDSKDLQRDVLDSYYYYLLAKLSELVETIFFVLRKRYRQVSFLHVYHHSLALIFTWVMIKYDPSEISLFIGTINSFVHIIMYSYYALSAFPRLTKYLWWKAYITKLQLSYLKKNVNTSNDVKYSGKEKKNITEDYMNGKHEKMNGVHTNGKQNGKENIMKEEKRC
ncbi:very long chain fatty acid elongase 7-like [Epargyreus clarus]|uniref:very long chain fatty acid elongase 7-like n=1 Tax=Epargyreus clarus TaxID=520877 RepID=UPI003C302408